MAGYCRRLYSASAMSSPPRLTRRNLGQLVADELLEMIQAGEFRPGDRIPTEQGLMDMFGVGRNSVRESVQALVALGVLDVRPGRGAVVLGLGSDDMFDTQTTSALLENQTVVDLYDFRRVLEVEMARQAAERGSEEEIERIGAALDRYRLELEAGRPVFQADLEFHRAVALASENVIFLRVLDAVADLLERARRDTDSVPGAKERALEEHTMIYEAIAVHDVDSAREAMEGHIESAVWAIGEFRRQLDEDSKK